jgi:hypothetical protein
MRERLVSPKFEIRRAGRRLSAGLRFYSRTNEDQIVPQRPAYKRVRRTGWSPVDGDRLQGQVVEMAGGDWGQSRFAWPEVAESG